MPLTRGHYCTLVKGQSRLYVRKYSFSQNTVNELTNLSDDYVHSTNALFNNRIDNYLVRAR